MKKTWITHTLITVLTLALVLGICGIATAATGLTVTGVGNTNAAVGETRTLGCTFEAPNGQTSVRWEVTGGTATLDSGATSTSMTPSLLLSAVGTVTISCTGTDDDGDLTPVVTTYEVKAMACDITSLALNAGQANYDMTQHVSFAAGNNHVFTLSSSDSSIVSVVDGVKLKANAKGSATVTISSTGSPDKAVAVTVNGKSANLQIVTPQNNSQSNPLKVAKGVDNKAKLQVSTDSNGTISWESLDASIASIPNDNVKTNYVTGNNDSSTVVGIRVSVAGTTEYEPQEKIIYVQVFAPVNITGVPTSLTVPVGETRSFIADTNSGEALAVSTDDSTIATIAQQPYASAGTIAIRGERTGTTKVRVRAGATEKVVNVTVGNPTPTITLTFRPDTARIGKNEYVIMDIHVDNPQAYSDGNYAYITRQNRRIYVDGYNYSHPSTYVYWVKLDQDNNASVYIRPQYSGNVKVSVDSKGAATKSRTFTVSGYPTLPQTGQDFTLIYVLGACCLAAAATWVIVYAKKKKNNVA